MALGNFSLTTVYTTFITMINAQLIALGNMFRDQTTGDIANQVRYSSANKRFEYWTGSAWAALDISSTGITTATNATNATTAANATTHIASAVGTEHGATASAVANMIARRDANGKLAGDILGSSTSCTGNSATATTLATPRAINGVNFNGSANITITAAANGGTSAACSGNSATATTATNSSGTGTVPLARYENGLRVIRGKINANGTIAQGAGFTATRSAPGSYTITFDNAFSQIPVVTATSEAYTYTSNATSVTASSMGLRTSAYTGSSYSLADSIINFIAIGPN